MARREPQPQGCHQRSARARGALPEASPARAAASITPAAHFPVSF